MKKLLIMFMMMLGTISINSTLIVSAEEESNKEFVSKYETWNLDLSEEELIQYYIDNDIRPASAPSGSDGTIVLVEEDIEAYLNGTLIFSSSGEMF